MTTPIMGKVLSAETVRGARIKCWDNGGKTCDRYAVLYFDLGYTWGRGGKEWQGRCMSESPCHPQGVGMWGEFPQGNHPGKRIGFIELPPDVQKCILADISELKETLTP